MYKNLALFSEVNVLPDRANTVSERLLQNNLSVQMWRVMLKHEWCLFCQKRLCCNVVCFRDAFLCQNKGPTILFGFVLRSSCYSRSRNTSDVKVLCASFRTESHWCEIQLSKNSRGEHGLAKSVSCLRDHQSNWFHAQTLRSFQALWTCTQGMDFPFQGSWFFCFSLMPGKYPYKSCFHVGDGGNFFDDVKEWSGPFFYALQLGIRLHFDLDVLSLQLMSNMTSSCENPWRCSDLKPFWSIIMEQACGLSIPEAHG